MMSKRGITLISLVITVIVLLILATVAINLAVNSEGLFTKTGEAANNWNSSVAEEEGVITEILQLADEIGKEPAINTFYQNGGSIEVKFVDKSNKIIEEPLAPVLGAGMTAVKWSGTEWTNTTASDEEWYDYSQSKWANAKTADGSMWVWIPRYAYEMTYTLAPYTSYTLNNAVINYASEKNIDEELNEINLKLSMGSTSYEYTFPAYPVEEEEIAKGSGSQYIVVYEKSAEGEYTYNMYIGSGGLSSEKEVAGYSNSKGIVTAEGRVVAKLESGVETAGKYIVHPAFGTDVDLGGWSEPLDGIWVAKYKMSMETDGVATTTDSTSVGNVLTTDSIKMVSKPDVSSWRNIQVGNMYTNCYNYDRTNESHMMKSSEWGAVAYISYSQYGTNGGAIAENTSETYITGTGGVAASSTGNETGIYDLNGSSYEFFASYDKLGGNNLTTNGSSFTTGVSTKYSTAYSNGTNNSMGKKTFLNVGKTGDVTREMLGIYMYGWNNSASVALCVNLCFARAGGPCGVVSDYGAASEIHSFRAVLAPANS